MTLPVIYALQMGAPSQRRRVRELFAAQCDDESALRQQHAELTGILHSSGALDRARAVSQAHTHLARANLGLLKPSQSRERLAALVTLLAVRDR
jgi:geranylgeranyl pyrophosphate synthase